MLKWFNRADEGEDCKRKEIFSQNIGRWIVCKKIIQLYEKMLLEKFISFKEVRSIISLVVKFLELIGFGEGGYFNIGKWSCIQIKKFVYM